MCTITMDLEEYQKLITELDDFNNDKTKVIVKCVPYAIRNSEDWPATMDTFMVDESKISLDDMVAVGLHKANEKLTSELVELSEQWCKREKELISKINELEQQISQHKEKHSTAQVIGFMIISCAATLIFSGVFS